MEKGESSSSSNSEGKNVKSGERRGRLSTRRNDNNSLSAILAHGSTCSRTPARLSFHGEAAGLLDRRQQLVVELVVALVGRNVNPIEAGGAEQPGETLTG